MSQPKLRILFAGTPEFAASSLQALIDSHHEVVGVYTQPDRPAGRGRKLTASPVKQLAQTHDIPVCQPVSLKSAEEQQTLAAFNADLMVVVAYGLLLPKAVLETPRLGCINVHASLLPRWRGAAPIHRALLAGDEETGITIMQMDVGLDTGDMLLKRSCAILDSDTSASLHDRLAALGAEALLATLSPLAEGGLEPQVQDHQLATYAHKLEKREGEINWDLPAAQLARQVRGLFPWPVAYTTLGEERVRVWEAVAEPEAELSADAQPGTLLSTDRDGLRVRCGEGVLRVTRLQFPGGKPLSVADLLNAKGERLQPGLTFSSEA